MPQRTKLLIASVILSAGFAVFWANRFPSHSWIRFSVFLFAILISSGLKVILPQGEGSMSLNFPFILLAVVQLSPLQAILLAAMSVAAQCRLRVKKLFTAIQIVFNIANSITSTAIASLTYLLLTQHGLGLAPALSAASSAYFFCNTIPVALAIATSRGENAYSLWKAEFPWYLPFYFVGAILAAVADGIGIRFGASTSLLLIPMVYTVYRAYTAQIVRAKERQQHLEETEALHLRTIEGLAMAIEAKDQETHEHLFRVRSYVAEVGKALQLSTLEMKALHTAAFLHDIGKLAVPEHIINKPGKLTLAEFEKMKIHPVVGADILDRVRFPYPVVPIVRSHHEWWNGQGYPDGLKGKEIPIGARILTIVDCFDALTSDRPYRKGKSLEDAMAIVSSLSGTQFDPSIVEVFQRHCMGLEKQTRKDEQREFVPLNKEIDVWRGAAPGAGLEQQNGDIANDLPLPAKTAEDDVQERQAALDRIALATQEAQTLFEISQSLRDMLTLEEFALVLTSRLQHLLPFDCLALYIKEGNQVILRHVSREHEKCFSIQPVPLGDGISGWVAENKKAILNGNAAVEPSYHPKSDQTNPLRSALSLPLFDLEQEVFGALTLYASKNDSFAKDHLHLLQAMELKVSLSLLELCGRNSSRCKPSSPGLIGLPKLKEFFLQVETELNRSRRSGTSFALIMCRMISLDEVNDLEGHSVGNRLLSSVADRFQEGCRPYDTVAHMGGNQFVFLMPHTNNEDLSERLACLSELVTSARHSASVKTEISVGIGASFFPADGEAVEDLIALADRRMHNHQQPCDHRHRSKAAETVPVSAV